MAQHEDTTSRVSNLEIMPRVLAAALAVMTEKARTYGESWKSRGGRGAWYTLVRPLDRLQLVMERDHAGDIFAAIEAEPTGGDGSVLDMVRDLRNYLTLVETEMVNRGVVRLPTSIDLPAESVARDAAAIIPEEVVERRLDEARDRAGLEEERAGTLGAGPVADGCYTILDLGHGEGLWHVGLGAVPAPYPGPTPLLHSALCTLDDATRELTSAGSLVASRRLQDSGDVQIIIRIPVARR